MSRADPQTQGLFAMDWKTVAVRLFPQGHTINQDGDFLSGGGRCGEQDFAVIGTTNHAEVGVELALAMARAVLDTVRHTPQQPILFLIDTCGQRLRHRDLHNQRHSFPTRRSSDLVSMLDTVSFLQQAQTRVAR